MTAPTYACFFAWNKDNDCRSCSGYLRQMRAQKGEIHLFKQCFIILEITICTPRRLKDQFLFDSRAPVVVMTIVNDMMMVIMSSSKTFRLWRSDWLLKRNATRSWLGGASPKEPRSQRWKRQVWKWAVLAGVCARCFLRPWAVRSFSDLSLLTVVLLVVQLFGQIVVLIVAPPVVPFVAELYKIATHFRVQLRIE